jgi:hypothetical protein
MSNPERQHPHRGPERRHHHVYLTLNSEYHCRDDLCVAVRNLQTGEFVDDHPAIGRRLTGAIRFNDDGGIASFSRCGEQPRPGENLYFSSGPSTIGVRTTGVRGIQRPPRKIVQRYHH